MIGQNIFNQASFLPENTIAYRTWIKWTLVQALRQVFANHPDPHLKTQFDSNGDIIGGLKIAIEYPQDARSYPAIVVKYSEREITNAGVGHIEQIMDPTNTFPITYKHYLYTGTVEFMISALSSLDRDLVADSLVQIVCMPEMEYYTNLYWNQIFQTEGTSPNLNFININTDQISGGGDSVTQQPWLSENYLQYQTSFRTNVFGEFYSLPPTESQPGFITEVDTYPWTALQGGPPPGIPSPSTTPVTPPL